MDSVSDTTDSNPDAKAGTPANCKKAIPSKTFLIHPFYGDLRRADSVRMIQNTEPVFFKETNPLFIHLTVTMKCSARCKGCINGSVTLAKSKNHGYADAVPQRDAAAILNLIEKDHAKDVAVCFYGGEPLLLPRTIEETITLILNGKPDDCRVRLMIYTNGMHIKNAVEHDRLFADAVWLYSISIDGGKTQHETVRLGTSFERIVENLEYLKRQSNVPQRLMWTTLREGQSLRDAFDAFVGLKEQSLVDHFFWHFVEVDEPFEDLKRFAACYEADLRFVLETYLDQLRRNNQLLSLLHINELVLYLLCGKERNSTACGVELSRNYDIVSGTVQTCADLPAEYTLGTIHSDGSLNINDRDLTHLVGYKDDLGCYACGIHAYCGGRCPVQALTCNQVRVRQYCQLMRLHVAVTKDYIPQIKNALEAAGLSLQDVYDRSAFYVQFTDVTP
jgi:radical SAM protein with 4Fe4S-binding SPASM domain